MRTLTPAVMWLLLVAAFGRADVDRACVTVGRAPAPPTVDGRIEAGEWSQAAAIAGFVTAGAGAVADPATTAYLMFDDRALYVALRCVEPDPARPRGFVRAHDDRAFEDDCVQVFVAPEDLNRAPSARINFGGYAGAYDNWYTDIRAYYEFTVNGQGSTTEARNDVRDWDAPWEAKVQREPGAWTVEMAIPFRSLGVTAPAEGALWGLNLFRVRQPEASGWVFPGFGGYTPLPLGAMCLSADGPVVRQAPVSPAKPGENALAFTVANPTAQPAEVEGTVSAPGRQPVSVTRQVAPGGGESLALAYQLSGYGDLRAPYSVKVRGREVPLLSGSVPLSRPEPYQVSLRYYALPEIVEGTVHLEAGATATRAVLAVHGPTGSPAESTADLTGKRGERLRLPVAGQPGDRFQATLRALDAAGSVVAEQKTDFALAARPAWLGTHAGLPLKVLPPWTPIRVSGRTAEMLGKRLTFRDLALPATVTSAEAELLAAPMRLVVESGGKEVGWERRRLRTAEQAEDHVRVESVWESAALALTVTCTVEYDGFSWVEVKLDPRGRASVNRLALEVPLRPEVARYAYEGSVQAAHALSPLGLRRSISANLWIGDEARGLAFLAESLEWVQSQDRARQVEVIPGRSETVWRSTLIDTPTELTAPYTARFALHVTPAKPVSLRKSRIFHAAYYGLESAPAGSLFTIPSQGHIVLAQGALELWVRPTFDTNETYDPAADRSRYNRQFFSVVSDQGQAFMLYYNADDRSFRAVTTDGRGGYPLVLGSPTKLPSKAWSYVGLSWGDALRVSVNGQVTEVPFRGSVPGGTSSDGLHFDLQGFDLDEVRLSGHPRKLDTVPTTEFASSPDTLYLSHCEAATTPEVRTVEGRFGRGLGAGDGTQMDQLAREGKRIVIFHEGWSRYQGYPDLEQLAKLKKIADACHARGMLFLVYFCQLMSDAAPEWPDLKDDFKALPDRMWYHRDDVKQDCWVSCVNGPYGDLLLDGIAKLADEAGIDGVYMDGTTVPWDCDNPTHPGCGEYQGDGTYLAHQPIRATREFMKRLRSIFAQRRGQFFLDAHTGGCINIATQSFCDGYYDGETLARYKPGFRLAPDAFLTGYMGRQFGFRGEFLPNRHTMDQALAICLVHDTATRGEPAAVDLAWADYEGGETRLVPYWEHSSLYEVTPGQVLGSLYLRPDRALLVLGSQTEESVTCRVNLAPLLRRLPAGTQMRDAVSGEGVPLAEGRASLTLPGRGWRMLELKRP